MRSTWSWDRVSANDDRGARVVLERSRLRSDRRNADAHFRMIQERVEEQYRISNRMVAVLIAFAVFTQIVDHVTGMTHLTKTLGLFAIAGVMWLIAVRSMARNAASGVIRVLLHDGICPSCTYSLEGLSPHKDGCYQCPECGAAWRADRVIRRRRFEEIPRSFPRRKRRSLANLFHELILLRELADDSGAVGRISKHQLKTALVATIDADRRARLNSVREELRSGQRRLRNVMSLFFALSTVYLFLFGSNTLYRSVQSGMPTSIILIPGLFLIAVTVMSAYFAWQHWNSAMVGATTRLRVAFLSHGICPRCASDLQGDADERGFVVCKECRSCWHARDVTAPSPATP